MRDPPQRPDAPDVRAPARSVGAGEGRVGRFRLLRVLGRGAQATVWLAHDERLDRDVAVKLLARTADAVAVSTWLHEARAVSRLTHPNVVPVFEADEADGQPYLVFEFVDGPTLAERLRRTGASPAREAVALMCGVLDGLGAAHARGIVHRDLKPSNILVDAADRARVMDFGIAARLGDGPEDSLCGTPGYMSPEAAQGLPPAPAMDVFAAGMVLAELLAGRPLLREPDPYRALERTVHEDIVLPPTLPPEADDALRAIVRRAISRRPDERWPTAAAFRAALAAWLAPPAAEMVAAANSTLDFLLRRMRHKADFPALSDSVQRIHRFAESDSENLHSLAAEILKDVALTHKLLRLVNSARYTTAAGPVGTVSRAVALVGLGGIRNMALSLVLLDHMQDKAHAAHLTEEYLRALLAAMLAAELTPTARDSEDAFLCGLLQQLGRLLTAYYFPEEAQQIRAIAGTPSEGTAVSDDAAARRVLGLSFEDLGCGVARHWGLPEPLQRAMRRPAGPSVRSDERGVDAQRRTAALAAAVADAVLADADSQRAVSDLANEHARALAITPQAVVSAAQRARERLAEMVGSLHVPLAPGARARRLLVDAAPRCREPGDADVDAHALMPTVPVAAGMPLAPSRMAGRPAAPAPPAADVLAAGIQDITNQMVEALELNNLLRMILETIYRALGFQRVVFCLREPRSEALAGRFGLGDRADDVVAAFKVSLPAGGTAAPDLFSAVCLKGVDTLIADATQPAIAARLPAWYRRGVSAPTFMLLPLVVKGAPFALIYADKAQPGAIVLSERELALLRTLRNQAVLAFRQAG